MRKIFTYLVLTLLCCVYSLGAYAVVEQQPLKVGFILCGPVTDMGWNYAHNEGRLFLEKALPGKVKTTIAESIPESAEVERVIEKMIAQGNRLIFTTSYGYLEPALRAAARHPDVVIMQCQRSVPASVKNMGTYHVRQYESAYVYGIVAGSMTKTNKLGYIGGHPVPLLLSVLNAYTLGAQSVNPKITVQTVWLNTWADPALEVEATKGLIESGVDVITAQLDSTLTAIKTCESRGAYGVGFGSDLRKIAPKSWLTGEQFNWGPLYKKIAQSVMDHTWKPSNVIYTFKDGYSGIFPYGDVVPMAVRTKADLAKKDITNGKLIIFKGPLKDREGQLKVSAGKALDDAGVAVMNWVVPGVQGSVSKGH